MPVISTLLCHLFPRIHCFLLLEMWSWAKRPSRALLIPLSQWTWHQDREWAVFLSLLKELGGGESCYASSSQDYATSVVWPQYLSWLLQSVVKKADRKCRRLMEWGELSSPGDFLMRWGDPEGMWIDKTGTAGTEMWGEKVANAENRMLAVGHCGISTSIYEWKAAYPNFSST